MRQLSSIDYAFLVREFSSLKGGRLQKIYQAGRNTFSFVFHVSGAGQRILRVELPDVAYLSSRRFESSIEPPAFCLALRRHISGMFLKEVSQPGFERIVRFVFASKDRECVLIAELFSTGNIVLCNSEKKIVSVLYPKKWKDRSLRGGVEYEPPVSRIDVCSAGFEEFAATIAASDRESVVKALAIDVGLGGLYSEEVLARAGVEKESRELSKAQLGALWKELRGVIEQEPEPFVVLEEGVPVDAYPFPLISREFQEKEPASSFSEAIEKVSLNEHIHRKKRILEERENAEMERLKRILEEQQQTVKALASKIEEAEATANFIYEHYAEVKGLIEEAAKARDKESLKGLRKGKLRVEQAEPKNKRILVSG